MKGHWIKGQLCRAPSVSCSTYKNSNLRLLLGVLGAPLILVHVSTTEPLPYLKIKDTPILLKRSMSANSEFESSIEGAIAHCKQSQQLLSSRMQFVGGEEISPGFIQ
ncbi:hypothetical protein C1H46_041385 [Malus baccata]|uniref:Uncharacterized protein n=1 Tax=Malus baccata TaxID=106549 RepID=A0A540KFS7_MALBA|nr:hypothetical protein C1H46_041385 [Malus baccata]